MSVMTSDKNGWNKNSCHQSSNNWQFIRVQKNNTVDQPNSDDIISDETQNLTSTESVSSQAPSAPKESNEEGNIESEDTHKNTEYSSDYKASSPLLGVERVSASAPPASHRISVGTAFVPLSDRIPRFLRAHQDSEFVIMATPRGSATRSRSADKRISRPIPTQESHFMERGRRRSSQLVSQEDFEYCSATEPLQTMDVSGHLYPTSSHNFKAKQSRPLRKSHQSSNETEGSGCRSCMARVPYATLIATIMCCVGVGVFCGTMYRGTTITMRMLQEVFRLQIVWVEPVQLTFLVVGAGMGGLGLMILFVGCLSTGATRARVYTTWRGRVGGRISCAIFMGLAYILVVVWLVVLLALVLITLMYTMAWMQCDTIPENQCIDYNQFGFMFPAGTREDDKKVCLGEKKIFCKDFVNNAEVMFILASASAFLVVLSLIHYLVCLSANYAHIKDQEKFMDLQDLQYIREHSEMSTLPKDRF